MAVYYLLMIIIWLLCKLLSLNQNTLLIEHQLYLPQSHQTLVTSFYLMHIWATQNRSVCLHYMDDILLPYFQQLGYLERALFIKRCLLAELACNASLSRIYKRT